MTPSRSRNVARFAASVAVLFGIATVIAGSRVLLGADPGYVVYKPLLLFNTAMGVAYLLVGVLAWRRVRPAMRGAAAIVVLNAAALVGIATLSTRGEAVAAASLQAMTFRTAAWVVIFLLLLWASRAATDRSHSP